MELKDKLRALRQERGLSQQALADAIFVSRSAVAKWENGLGLPSEASMQALTNYFHVTEAYFSTEEPEKVIEKKNSTIRDLALATAAILLVAALTLSMLLLPSLLQITPKVGFSSQAAAGLFADDPCIHTENLDFYLSGINIVNQKGQVIGYSINDIASVRKLGMLYYRQTLHWHCREVSHSGEVIGTLISYQDAAGYHNIFTSNSAQLLVPLLELDTVTVAGKICPVLNNAYFLTQKPVDTMEIKGYRLDISDNTEIIEQ